MRDPVKDAVVDDNGTGFMQDSLRWGSVTALRGRKDDGGKAPWNLLMRGCALALAGVVTVLKFGSEKYAADSWQNVENAETRYRDALYRHLHSIEVNGFMSRDPETGLLEWYHVACNALFLAHFAAQRAAQGEL